MWVPHPRDIILRADGGSANMGDVSDDSNHTARFLISGGRYVVAFMRCTFTGGTGTADCAVKIDSNRGPNFDHTLHTFKAVGSGSPIHARVPAEELYEWVIDAGEHLVFEWTNPDSGNTHWALEVGLVLAD